MNVPGSDVVYNPSTGQLTVHNTAEQMEYIEELVNGAQAPVLMVKISCKFVEINQDELNDLTFNSAFNFWNPNPAPTVVGGVVTPTPGPVAVGGPASNNLLTLSRFNTALPGSQAFSSNNIDQLLNPTANNFNSFYLRSFLDGAQYNVVAQALSQQKSYDLLSDPYTTGKSGEQSVIEAVRVFPYPTAFDSPQLQTNNASGGAGGIVHVRSGAARGHRGHPHRLQKAECRRAPGRETAGGGGQSDGRPLPLPGSHRLSGFHQLRQSDFCRQS